MAETVRKRQRLLGALFGLLAGAVVLVVVAAATTSALKSTEIRDTQLEGTPTGRRLLESSDRILDCTDPKGECYKRNQKRTAEAVGDIGRYIVLASACAAGVDPALPVDQRIAEITDCVTERLAD